MGCKFYGAHAVPEFGAMFTQAGNQCALITGRYAPCRMEIAGEEVDFEKCELKGSRAAVEFAAFTRRDFVPPKETK
jgi:hypothetical protein